LTLVGREDLDIGVGVEEARDELDLLSIQGDDADIVLLDPTFDECVRDLGTWSQYGRGRRTAGTDLEDERPFDLVLDQGPTLKLAGG
jgi:hypothetical protein